MVRTTRRSLIGAAAATSTVIIWPHRSASAQDATPTPIENTGPAHATARVRIQPSAALNQAIYPDVMATFVPAAMAIPGFLGYAFVFDAADPATAFTVSTLTGEPAARASEDVGQAYVDQLDPRFITETPLSAEGRVRMYATTAKPATELPPFLHGAAFTMRDQTNAPGLDLEDAIRIATATLIPLFRSLPGFVLYCWFERPGGRIAINIWETAADLAAASEALAAWREEHFATPTASQEQAYNGTVGYATIAGLT
jgi:hypothetical protein